MPTVLKRRSLLSLSKSSPFSFATSPAVPASSMVVVEVPFFLFSVVFFTRFQALSGTWKKGWSWSKSQKRSCQRAK